MIRCTVMLFALGAIFVASDENFGPKYPPTEGEIWPKPLQQKTELNYYTFDPQHFNVSLQGKTCAILEKAIERYSFLLRDLHRLARRYGKKDLDKNFGSRQFEDEFYDGRLQLVNIDLTEPCEEYPYYGMVESYNLTVNVDAQLTSSSIWGILRGLESLSQLFYIPDNEAEIRINRTVIHDAPRYIHRGLLIDTSRHYLSLSKIIKTLDAMGMNKMNVLHWHIVDDQSFPYVSEKFPNLSRLGAFHSSMVYTADDIRMVINYARDRGIRVLPEFDVPGHTRSWGQAYPELLTPCFSENKVTHFGPMNPIKNGTYAFLKELIIEVQELFPDKFFHVGGDEVELDCWISNPEILEYMIENNCTVQELHGLFMSRVIPLLQGKSTPIIWQEVFDEKVQLSRDTLVHVWKGDEIMEMMKVLRAGYKLLFSSSWYLDSLSATWVTYYKADPRQLVAANSDKYNLDNIVGGEACMWGEMVNDYNVISRVWPRASAVAERLWSPEVVCDHPNPHINDPRACDIPEEVFNRIEEHVCRMNRRGIKAQPASGPGFCLGAA